MSLILRLVIATGILSWLHSILMTLQTWESVRFARSRNRAADNESPAETMPRVAVMVPCKGTDDDLVVNLVTLFHQDHPNYEILFIVESKEDPAFAVLQDLMAANSHVAARIITAGRAVDCGQKVHNLLAAVSEITASIRIFAFMDSDACPRQNWLSQMVAMLGNSQVGAVTGYRWLIPETNHLANLLIYSVNSALAGIMGPGFFNLVWGGSWAIRREVFEATGIREAWAGTLSDDLVASRVLLGAKFKVHFEPNCVAHSPINISTGSAAEFLRRQYLISRRYATNWWRIAFVSLLGFQCGLWSSLGYAIFGDVAFWRVASSVSFVGLYGLSVLRAHRRQQLVAIYSPGNTKQLLTARQFDVWLAPVLGIANILALCASLFGSSITWRGIRYWISPGGRILALGRRPTISQIDEAALQRERESELLAEQSETDHEPILLPFSTTAKPKNQNGNHRAA